MKTTCFFLFLQIFIINVITTSAQENDSVILNPTKTISDSLSRKWFKQHEFSYGRLIIPNYQAEDINHKFDYRYNLGVNALRFSFSAAAFKKGRYVNDAERITPTQTRRNAERYFNVRTNNIVAGYEWRTRFMNSLCLFYGAQAGYQWAVHDIATSFSLTNMDGAGQYVSSESGWENLHLKEHSILISPFLGLRVDIVQNLAIGIEANYNAPFGIITGNKTTNYKTHQKKEKVNDYSVWHNRPGPPTILLFGMLKF